MRELSLEELQTQEQRLIHRIQQLKEQLQENRNKQAKKPRRRSDDISTSVLNFIRLNPGLMREDIMQAQNVGAGVLTQLLRDGTVYTTEVENRFRRYYVR